MVILRAKVAMLGDAGVGKSALSQYFHSDGTHYPKAYNMTTGVEVLVKAVQPREGGETVELLVLDCAGNSSFQPLVDQQLQDATVIVIAFEVGSRTSLDHCEGWLNRARDTAKCKHVTTILVGAKADAETRREVTVEDAQAFAEALGVPYFECSARDGHGTDAPFEYIADAMRKAYHERLSAFEAMMA